MLLFRCTVRWNRSLMFSVHWKKCEIAVKLAGHFLTCCLWNETGGRINTKICPPFVPGWACFLQPQCPRGEQGLRCEQAPGHRGILSSSVWNGAKPTDDTKWAHSRGGLQLLRRQRSDSSVPILSDITLGRRNKCLESAEDGNYYITNTSAKKNQESRKEILILSPETLQTFIKLGKGRNDNKQSHLQTRNF